MRSIEIGSSRLCSLDDRSSELTYYLLVDELECGGAFALESYGVKVEKRSLDGFSSAQCRNVTCSREKIDRLIGALMRGTVTPVALKDVLEDWE